MPYKLSVDLPAVNGGADVAVLGDKSDIFQYADGKKTDVREGVKLTIALQNANLSTLTVKFDHDPLPKVTSEQIAEACLACNFLFVKIPDSTVNLFSSSSGGIGMTATAETAQLVNPNNK